MQPPAAQPGKNKRQRKDRVSNKSPSRRAPRYSLSPTVQKTNEQRMPATPQLNCSKTTTIVTQY
jgi:hypothetical protein